MKKKVVTKRRLDEKIREDILETTHTLSISSGW
jgi:hypothetical protein